MVRKQQMIECSHLHELREVIVVLQVHLEVGHAAVRVPIAANVCPLNNTCKYDVRVWRPACSLTSMSAAADSNLSFSNL